MNNKLYDVITVVQRWLVALGVAYLGLAAIWGWPFPDEINNSIVIVSTLLATIIEIEKSYWNKNNTIEIKTDKDKGEDEWEN